MIESISTPFIRFPIGTSLLMAGILFIGLVSYPLLPVAPLPQVDFPTIQVNATLPGASPETMASSVAQPLERQLAQIPGVAQMTSTSSLGSTAVTIQFDLNRNIDAAANDILGAINAASGQLPKNLPSPPTYRKVNPADAPIMLLSATSDTVPLIRLSDAIDVQLGQQISQISGVAQVFIGGQQKPSIRIQVDPAKLVAKGLSLEDVRNQIAITTVDSPKGNIDGDKRAFTIYTNDQLPDSKDWNDVIIAFRNGAPLRIRDIGQADRNSRSHRAPGAARRLRADVGVRLYPRQFVADGTDDCGRFRGRRRHRDAGEYCKTPRDGEAAHAGGDRWR